MGQGNWCGEHSAKLQWKFYFRTMTPLLAHAVHFGPNMELILYLNTLYQKGRTNYIKSIRTKWKYCIINNAKKYSICAKKRCTHTLLTSQCKKCGKNILAIYLWHVQTNIMYCLCDNWQMGHLHFDKLLGFSFVFIFPG